MTARRHPHPSVYMFLITPWGVLGGYLSVALAFLLSRNHVRVEAIAALVAAGLVPNVWKFLWAPVVDTTLSSRKWYLLSAVVTAAGILGMSALPMNVGSLPLLTTIILVSNFGATFMAMATDRLMARATPEDEKGRAGGWFQAGNLGGNGIGGGVGLLLAQRLPAPWMSGAILAGLCLLCVIPIAWVHEPPAERARGLARNVALLGADVWKLARARMGLLALVLCFMPIGSGAASGLWSAVAADWRASAETVALVTGVLGGVVMAAGSLAGGWVCDRVNRKVSYAAYGVLQALCAVAMAISPHDEHMYFLWTTVYAFITGLTYAGFTAVVLEAMGAGAAATKYNLYASLSNFPIMYMTTLDGRAHSRWGPSGMLYTEAVVGLLGLALFVGFLAAVRRWWPAHWPVTVTDPGGTLEPPAPIG